MLIRAETQKNEYFDFGELLDDIKSDNVIKYFLVVNDEEIEIPSSMAAGISYFFDEYNREVCKLDE
jgi:hypothetical protein